MTRYPWRYRCPEGHASVYLSTNRIWCQSCSEAYDKSEMQDLAQTGP